MSWRPEISIHLTTGPLPVVDLFILCKIFIERIISVYFYSNLQNQGRLTNAAGFFLALSNKQIYVLKIIVLKNKC